MRVSLPDMVGRASCREWYVGRAARRSQAPAAARTDKIARLDCKLASAKFAEMIMTRLSEDYRAGDSCVVPLSKLDVSDGKRFQDVSIWACFERLRKEDPVHYCQDSAHGPYWSVTKYRDIVAVDTDHRAFSSEQGVTIVDMPGQHWTPSFLSRWGPQARRAAQYRKSDRGAGKLDEARRLDPVPGQSDPRGLAAQRGLQLGGYGLHRVDDANVGDAIRLSI